MSESWCRESVASGQIQPGRRTRQLVRSVILILVIALVSASCSITGDDGPEPPDVLIAVTSGNFSTTVRPDRTTDVPFSEVLLVDVEFEDEVIGSAGQTAVRVSVEPTSYRVEQRSPRDRQTYSFALRNPTPGEVTVEIYENADATPVTFTLAIGTEDD